MVKTISLFLLFVTVSIATVSAQKNNDAIYFKNGSIIRGTIISPSDSTKIGIETKDNTFLLFDKEEVVAVKKGNHGAKPNDFSIKLSSGIYGGAQLSHGTKLQGGYNLSDRFYVGLGTGYEGFNERYVPLFLEGELNLSTAKTKPYLYLYGGYSFFSGDDRGRDRKTYRGQTGKYFGILTDYRGGALYGVGVGINKYFGAGFGAGFQLGYRFQRISYTHPLLIYVPTTNWSGYYYENGVITVINSFHRFEVSLFLSF